MTEYILPERKQRNLAKLALFCRTLPEDYEHFDIKFFAYGGNGRTLQPCHVTQPEDLHACGTVACLAGHGPVAGIPPVPGEGWPAYIDRVFIPGDGPANQLCMAWLFENGHTNSLSDGCKRIAWLLEGRSLQELLVGLEEEFDWIDVLRSKETPCDYELDWALIEKLAAGA
jgi:hypothetical protein